MRDAEFRIWKTIGLNNTVPLAEYERCSWALNQQISKRFAEEDVKRSLNYDGAFDQVKW